MAGKAAPAPTPAQSNPYGGFGYLPMMDAGMTFREIGSSGLRAFAGYVRDEWLPQLQWRQGATVYREMRDNNPIIGGLLFAIKSTMRKPEWRINPADDTPAAQEAADFADSLRFDMSSTWEETISEVCSMLEFGFAPLEIVYKKRMGQDPGDDPVRPGKKLPKSKYTDGKIGWRKLPLRGQETVFKWFFDENGEVQGMTQQPWVGPIIDLPIEKLLLFRPSQLKGNPEGISILRNAYRPYYMLKRLEEQEAILFERLNGIPVIKVPSTLMDAANAGDANAAQAIATFKKIAVNVRVDEQMGIVLPSDTFTGPNGPTAAPMYSFELVSPGGIGGRTTVAPDTVITRHQNNILISCMADFLTLGHGARGTQALSLSKQDMFFQAIESYLNAMGGVFTRHGLSRIWALNGMDPDLMPEFAPDLAQRVDLDVLSNYVLRLSQAGMALFPNRDLESALLDGAGLPDVQDADAMSVAEQEPVAIVGPRAAAAVAQNTPQPTDENGKPVEPVDTKFGKMIMASLARRMQKNAGPRFGINTRKRRRIAGQAELAF